MRPPMTDAEAAKRVLNTWGYFAVAVRIDGRCILRQCAIDGWRIRGEGDTWEAAWRDVERRSAKPRGPVWGEWETTPCSTYLLLHCDACGERRYRMQLTRPWWEGDLGARAEAAERVAIERWACPHRADVVIERGGLGR